MKNILFASFLLSTTVFAHETHDWRTDYQAYLSVQYDKLGFTSRFENFGGGSNFVAEKLGKTSPDKVLILSSHIDTVRCKGANDNGTGTIGNINFKMIYRNDYDSEIALRNAIFEYIETWYNRKKLHSSLGYLSPMEYEKINKTAA
jgi:transposase InsO family protein